MIKSHGGGHVRLPISLDIIESGTTGTRREDRFQDLKNFIARAKTAGLVTIVDIHNVGQKRPDGSWNADWMGGLRIAATADRHFRLLTSLARRLYLESDRNYFILQPAVVSHTFDPGCRSISSGLTHLEFKLQNLFYRANVASSHKTTSRAYAWHRYFVLVESSLLLSFRNQIPRMGAKLIDCLRSKKW